MWTDEGRNQSQKQGRGGEGRSPAPVTPWQEHKDSLSYHSNDARESTSKMSRCPLYVSGYYCWHYSNN